MTTALPPLSDADWPESAGALREGFAGKLNVYRVMAHHPALLNAWAPLRQHLVLDSALGPVRSEVVILRTGFRLGSEYEWAHHVVRGRKAGLADARILSIKGPLEGMQEEDRLLCTAVDELFDQHGMSPQTRDSLMLSLGKDVTLDLIALVGFYSVLGGILNSFDTPLDENIATALKAEPI